MIPRSGCACSNGRQINSTSKSKSKGIRFDLPPLGGSCLSPPSIFHYTFLGNAKKVFLAKRALRRNTNTFKKYGTQQSVLYDTAAFGILTGAMRRKDAHLRARGEASTGSAPITNGDLQLI
jgi:hypothetical protein